MTSVVHTFRKLPYAKHLAKRSLSFVESEISHVGNNDVVIIDISAKNFSTKIQVTGADFLRALQNRTAKNGTKVKVFKF